MENILHFILLKDSEYTDLSDYLPNTLAGTILPFRVLGELDTTYELLVSRDDCIAVADSPKRSTVMCKSSDVDKLTEIDYKLLDAIKTLSHRLQVYKDESWMSEGRTLVLEDRVRVIDDREGSVFTGVIKYKGPLKNKGVGTFFAVFLDPEWHGQGTNDGVFANEKYFDAPDDCCVFVSLFRLRRAEAGATNMPSSVKYPLEIGERVVWVADRGPEYGVVQWIGTLEDEPEVGVTVGVQFDNKIGSGTGKYRGRQLFTALRGYASLVPLSGLMKAEAFEGQRRREGWTGASSEELTASAAAGATESLGNDDGARLFVGSRVSVMEPPRYGIVRWLGLGRDDRRIAGLEMDVPDVRSYGDGTFEGKRRFRCPSPPNRALFVRSSACQPGVQQSHIVDD